VARDKWNEKFKPEGRDKKLFKHFNNGEPDVLYFVYNPDRVKPYVPGEGKRVSSQEEGMAIQEEAVKKLNAELESGDRLLFSKSSSPVTVGSQLKARKGREGEVRFPLKDGRKNVGHVSGFMKGDAFDVPFS
jgi:hypothetical protein